MMSAAPNIKLSTMTQDAMVYRVSSFYGSLFVLAQLELGLTPFTEHLRCKLPFHCENSRTYNSMLCVLLLRILGPITLCLLSWDLQFHQWWIQDFQKGGA